MIIKLKNLFILVGLSLLLINISSCISSKKAAYFQSGGNDTTRFLQEPILNSYIPRMQPNDIISITVTSPYSNLAGQNENMFNSQVTQFNPSTINSITSFSVNPNLENSNIPINGYLIDSHGNINFPIIGSIHLGGLTSRQAEDTVQVKVTKFLKDPVVNIRYLNYKITVLGEVLHPSTFTVPDEKVTILDALGLAGDMTIYGRRDNVLVIREENGKRIFARVNLNSQKIFQSPYFYLHQGDVVYVEPDKAKIASTNKFLTFIPYLSLILSTLSTAVIIKYYLK